MERIDHNLKHKEGSKAELKEDLKTLLTVLQCPVFASIIQIQVLDPFRLLSMVRPLFAIEGINRRIERATATTPVDTSGRLRHIAADRSAPAERALRTQSCDGQLRLIRAQFRPRAKLRIRLSFRSSCATAGQRGQPLQGQLGSTRTRLRQYLCSGKALVVCMLSVDSDVPNGSVRKSLLSRIPSL